MKQSIVEALSLAALVLGVFAPKTACAQQLVYSATAEMGSGIEGSGRGVPFRRSRTMLRLGGDAFIDEFPKDNFTIGLLLEVEPRTGAGFDARYVRQLTERVFGGIGGAAMLFPQSLYGVSGEVSYRYPIAKNFTLTVSPVVNVFVLGSDLPNDSVLWQSLIRIGIRAPL